MSPQPAPIMCSGVLLQREPAHFTGEDDTDAQDWLTSYERVSIHNKWDDTMKLNNVDLYLDKVARLWFRNNTTDTRTWTDFKARFLAAFARPAVRKLQAEQRLRKRAQEEDEAYTSYIEDVVDLCRRVNPAMPECNKIEHILKGIEDYAFQMLLGKNPQTVSEVTNLCLSYDELRKQRVFTRQRPSPNDDFSRGSLSSLTLPPDLSCLLPHIQQFVREEVTRQISLLPSAPVTAGPLPPTVRRLVRQQVAETLPSFDQPPPLSAPVTSAVTAPFASPSTVPFAQPVAAPLEPQLAVPLAPPVATPLASPETLPLSYAGVVRQLQPGAFQPYYRTPDLRTMAYNRPPAQTPNPWRTPDNRPICYACCTPGHVARLCRRRPSFSNNAPYQAPAYGPQQYFARVDTCPTPSSYPVDQQPFPRRRSSSPRSRSLSPMRPRQTPPTEGN